MNLLSLQRELAALPDYPIEQWQPPFCGSLPIRIDREGQWFYQDDVFTRPELVRLFAAVLSCVDGRYLLTTPAEQVEIAVADAPFLAVAAHWQTGSTGAAELWLTGNLGQQWCVSQVLPVALQAEPGSGQQLPYLQLPRGLRAKFSRNLYYQLAEQASIDSSADSEQFWLQSGDYRFRLG